MPDTMPTTDLSDSDKNLPDGLVEKISTLMSQFSQGQHLDLSGELNRFYPH